MRVLFARAGIPYSPFTGKPITSQTITQIVDLIKKLPKKIYNIYIRTSS
jgi:excinuclease ABC subunit A